MQVWSGIGAIVEAGCPWQRRPLPWGSLAHKGTRCSLNLSEGDVEKSAGEVLQGMIHDPEKLPQKLSPRWQGSTVQWLGA